MGGESCSSASAQGQDHKNNVSGNDIELLNLKNAQLYLVDEEESVLMQCGDFKLVLTKQLHTPLAALVGIVKDVEWPVGKDCVVFKLGRGCYTFGLPGILYGLLLPDSTSKALRQLELSLRKYCTFKEDLQLAGQELEIEGCFHRSRGAITEQHQQKKGDVALSPRMMKRVQKARRLSAVSKLFSRALLKGAISNVKHITKNNENAKPSRKDEAVASVDAVTKVVEAVESPLELALRTGTALNGSQDVNHQQHSSGFPIGWTLNALGVQLLIGSVAASTAINLSKPVGKPARPPLPTSSSNPYHNGSNCRHGFRPLAPQNNRTTKLTFE